MTRYKPSLNKLFKNSFYMLLGNGAVGVIQFFTVSVFILNYNISGYGLFVLIKIFLPAGLLLIIDFGISDSVVRFISSHYKDIKSQQEFITFGFLLALIISLFASLGLMSQADFIGRIFAFSSLDEAAVFIDLLKLIGLCIPFLFIGTIFESIHKGIESFATLSFIDFLVALSFLIILAIAPFMGIDLFTVILMHILLLNLKVVYLFSLILIRNRSLLRPRVPSFNSIKDITRFSLTFFIGKACSLSSSHIPSFILGIIDVTFVGIFDAITRIPKFIKTLIGKTNMALLPYAAKMIRDNELVALSNTLKSVVKYQLYLWVPVILILSYYSEIILTIWLGPDLALYSYHLSFFLIIIAFNCFVSPLSAIATSSIKNLKTNNFINYIELFVLIITTIFLFKEGINGIFIAFFISLIIKYFMTYYLFKERINYSLTIFRPFLDAIFVSLFFVLLSALLQFGNSIGLTILFSIIWVIFSWLICINFFLSRSEKLFVLDIKNFFLRGN